MTLRFQIMMLRRRPWSFRRPLSSRPSSAVTTTTSSQLPTTPFLDLPSQGRIQGQESHVALVDLHPGQTLRAEAGSLLFMTEGVTMETKLAGASAAVSRVLTGQSLFVTDYTYQGDSSHGTVGLGPAFPSKLLPMHLQDHPDHALICQRGAFLACNGTDTVEMTTEMTHNLSTGFFGGQGFILQRLSSQQQGQVWIQAGGTVVRKELDEGQVLRVTSGSIVAFETTVQYNIQTMPGISNAMFGGEGLFVTTLTGPGTVWLQGLPADRMIAEIVRRVPSGAGGLGWGVPMGMGGGDAGAAGGADEAAAAAAGTTTGAEEAVAATDAAVDADRQATVASSGLDTSGGGAVPESDSPEALFGDVAGTPPPSSYEDADATSTPFSETTFTDDTATMDETTTTNHETTFMDDDDNFWGSNNDNNSQGAGDGELFDNGSSADGDSSMSGDDEEGGGMGSVMNTLWDLFTGGDD